MADDSDDISIMACAFIHAAVDGAKAERCGFRRLSNRMADLVFLIEELYPSDAVDARQYLRRSGGPAVIPEIIPRRWTWLNWWRGHNG